MGRFALDNDHGFMIHLDCLITCCSSPGYEGLNKYLSVCTYSRDTATENLFFTFIIAIYNFAQDIRKYIKICDRY